MAKNSETRDALRSFLPETYLIRRRDAHALHYKYEARLLGSWRERWDTFRGPGFLFSPEQNTSLEYEQDAYFGGLSVEARASSMMAATDPLTGATIRMYEEDATLLHISSIAGAQDLRTSLRAVAAYIKANRPLRQTEYVAGLTYRELGRIGLALGLREMQIHEIDPKHQIRLHAAHMAYCAINHITHEFQPMAVFLPTDEFVQTFQWPQA